MAEYLAPGVYIEEIERGPKPIEGVPTSTAAFLGETERGPLEPRLVTSFNEFRRYFGNVYDADQYLPYAMASFFDNGGKRCYVARICGAAAVTANVELGESNEFTVKAVGRGVWGNRIFVKIEESTTRKAGSAIGIRLRVAYWANKDAAIVDPFTPPATDAPAIVLPDLVEDFDDLVLDNPSSANYFEKRVAGNSALILFEFSGATPPVLPPEGLGGALIDGSDGDPVKSADFKGEAEPSSPPGAPVDPTVRTERIGLSALLLDQYREVSLVYAPGKTEADVVSELVTHCEKNRFRFAVIDCSKDLGNPGSIDPRSDTADADGLGTDSSYAAYYYPWIKVSDPKTGVKKKIPPGGAMLGIYARTDNERGVFKAPANEIVRGALELEYNIDEGNQAVLNPRGVNVIRQFPGRGIRAWGARTLSSDALWKYVSVRRLFIFIERSIYEGTQWVVFEPNDERLWARVRDTIRLFLRTQFRAGALMGATEAEAFRITCDRSTMTQDDILNGRLICEVGIAPVRPAEFVVFRVFQLTEEAKT